MESKRHKLLNEISDYVQEIAKEFKMEDDAAEQLGINVADFIATHFGGQNFTFPKDYFFKLAECDFQIYNEHKGHNWAELSAKYNITERGLRKIIAKVHKRLKSKHQPGLFGDDNEY